MNLTVPLQYGITIACMHIAQKHGGCDSRTSSRGLC